MMLRQAQYLLGLLGICRQHILYLQILCKLLKLAHLQLGPPTPEGSKSVQIVITTVIPLAPPLPVSRELFTVEALAASSSHIPTEVSGSPMMILCCPWISGVRNCPSQSHAIHH